jgi:hypothetical protein
VHSKCSKHRKAEELAAKGQTIVIVSERDFARMVEHRVFVDNNPRSGKRIEDIRTRSNVDAEPTAVNPRTPLHHPGGFFRCQRDAGAACTDSKSLKGSPVVFFVLNRTVREYLLPTTNRSAGSTKTITSLSSKS